MSEGEKVKGPQSYFPSIEAKHGKPISHWIDIARSQAGKSHMQIVAHLKDEYALGHGHANAIVAHTLAQDKKA